MEQLLADKLRAALPPFDTNQDLYGDPFVFAKFFTLWGLRFFVIEGEQRDDDFAFLVYGEGGGSDAEFEIVMLSTFESMKGPFGLGVERDVCFQEPQRLSEVSASYRRMLSNRTSGAGKS